MPAVQPVPDLLDKIGESSIGDIGDAPAEVLLDLNGVCTGLSLSAADSDQSTGKDDPQAPRSMERDCRVARESTPTDWLTSRGST